MPLTPTPKKATEKAVPKKTSRKISNVPSRIGSTGGESVRSQEILEIENKLRDTELKLAALQLKQHTDDQGGLAAALETQTKVFEKLLNEKKEEKAKKKPSTIRVEPRLNWPRLGDEDLIRR